jgi:hypothetical protein
MTKSEREHARKHLYLQPGSKKWFAPFYLHGKQIRATTGTADETEACRVVLDRLDELGADRGARKFFGPNSMFDRYSITSDGDKRTALEQRQSYNARQEVALAQATKRRPPGESSKTSIIQHSSPKSKGQPRKGWPKLSFLSRG